MQNVLCSVFNIARPITSVLPPPCSQHYGSPKYWAMFSDVSLSCLSLFLIINWSPSPVSPHVHVLYVPGQPSVPCSVTITPCPIFVSSVSLVPVHANLARLIPSYVHKVHAAVIPSLPVISRTTRVCLSLLLSYCACASVIGFITDHSPLITASVSLFPVRTS